MGHGSHPINAYHHGAPPDDEKGRVFIIAVYPGGYNPA